MDTGRILFFGYTDFSQKMKASALQQELKKLGYDCYLIGPESNTRKIYEILYLPEASGSAQSLTLPESFILFCQMTGEKLQTALDICRGNIRAVLTAANSMMTPYELCEHLTAERQRERMNRQ